MKEKIFKYLKEKNSKVATQEIIEKFFHVYDQYPPHLGTIVESMLNDDPRLVRNEIGEWQVQKKYQQQNLADAIFSIVEIEVIPIDSKREIPILLGIARVENEKLISQEIFSLDIPTQNSPQFKKQINQFQENVTVDQAFNGNAEAIYHNLVKTIIISYAPSKVMAIMNYFFRNQVGLELDAEIISLVNLARKLIPGTKIRTIEDIARSLSISFLSPLDLNKRLNLMSEILITFLQKYEQYNIQTIHDLREFIEATKTWVDFSNYNFNRDYIKNLPASPGVYLMKDRQGQIFYVGKSKNLKSRIESYFVNRFEMDEKGKTILKRIFDLDYEPAGSELEALLLEHQYINEYHPDVNTQIKIHRLDVSKYEAKQIIIFLPGITEEQIVLFLVKGTNSALRILINNKAKPGWPYLKEVIKQFFFEQQQIQSSYSVESVELIWRWFSFNKEKINFVDIEKCGSLVDCVETVRKYCADEKLFSDKVYYL